MSIKWINITDKAVGGQQGAIHIRHKSQLRVNIEARGSSDTIGLLVSVIWKCELGAGLISWFDRAFDGLCDLNISTSRTITNAAVDVKFLCYTSVKLFLQ